MENEHNENLEEKLEVPQEPKKGFALSKTHMVLLSVLSVVGVVTITSVALYFTIGFSPSNWFLEDEDNVSVRNQVFDAIDNMDDPDTNSEVLYLHTASVFSQYREPVQPGYRDFTPSLDGEEIIIDWQKGAKVASVEMRKVLEEMTKDAEIESVQTYQDDSPLYGEFFLFEAGKITSPGRLEGITLYLISEGLAGMGTYYGGDFVIYDEELYEFIYIVEDENICVSSQLCKSFMLYEFPELEAPETLNIPGEESILIQVGYLIKKQEDEETFFSFGDKGTPYNRGGLVNVEEGLVEPLPDVNDIVFTDPTYGPVYFVNDQFRIIMPDGSVYKYDLVPYFFNVEEIRAQKEMYDLRSKVNIDWNEDVNGGGMYSPSGDLVEGCGISIAGFPNIFDDKEWFAEDKLVKVGETTINEQVYAFEESQANSYYKDVFNVGYETGFIMGEEVSGEWSKEKREELESMSEAEKFNDFIEDDPIFFWQDHWGNWRGFRKAKYQTLAECAKPVIYLYPEEDLDIHVQVNPEGGFKLTDPDYGKDGWFVRASKDSEILNYADGKEYEYLFWEGYEYNYEVPCYGFVMSRGEVGMKMYDILEKLGMNKKESEDFMEFWQEKLVEKPYVFVTFLPQSKFDKIVPLDVDPDPDTAIRVFMDYTPLDRPIRVREPLIKTPERKGFTVVEWGGRLK